MILTKHLDSMTFPERYGAVRLLSRKLHHSALLAKQRGDDCWRVMELLADQLLWECDAIALGGSRRGESLIVEAIFLLQRFDDPRLPELSIH